MARTISLLDQVRIASPCNVPWSDMTGDEKVRFCGQCRLHVYNIVSMSREAAEALIREKEGGELCIRLRQRRDGTVLTRDCPVGLLAARKRLAKLMSGIAAVFVAMLSMGFVAAGKAHWTERLKRFEPFARLTNWLDPAPILTAGAIAPNSSVLMGKRCVPALLPPTTQPVVTGGNSGE